MRSKLIWSTDGCRRCIDGNSQSKHGLRLRGTRGTHRRLCNRLAHAGSCRSTVRNVTKSATPLRHRLGYSMWFPIHCGILVVREARSLQRSSRVVRAAS